MARPGGSSLFKSLNRSVGKALHRYDMIEDGDRIAVGLSGGKDSLTLLWILNERRKRVPVKYELFPIHIDPGFEGGFSEELKEFGEGLGVDVRAEKTDYGPYAHSDENRENPCFLCARLRRKRIFEIADQLGCNKVALGHHKDDIIETFFINVFYAGEISTMIPSQSFFGGRFIMIRPLAFTGEDLIRRFAKANGFPELKNPCPSSGTSKRSEIKSMLDSLYRTNRKIRGNIFRALSHAKPEYLL